MHQLPVNDPRFSEFLNGLRIARDSGIASGRLPPYDVFVDRLFKEMPTVSLTDVQRLIKAVAGGDSGGKVDVEELLRELQNLDGPNGSAMHAAVGCAGEGGEMLDCVKKVFIYGKAWTAIDKKTGQTALENLLEEMGDFRFYYQKLLNMLGISDADVQAHNYAKLSERYSSGVYTDAHALERADKDKPFEQTHIGQRSALPPAPPKREFLGQNQPLTPNPARRKDDTQ